MHVYLVAYFTIKEHLHIFVLYPFFIVYDEQPVHGLDECRQCA